MQGEPHNLVNGAGVDLGRRWAAVLGALWQLGRGEVHPLLREEKRLATSLREAILAQVPPPTSPHPAPCNLDPAPYPEPCTLNPAPYTLGPGPWTTRGASISPPACAPRPGPSSHQPSELDQHRLLQPPWFALELANQVQIKRLEQDSLVPLCILTFGKRSASSPPSARPFSRRSASERSGNNIQVVEDFSCQATARTLTVFYVPYSDLNCRICAIFSRPVLPLSQFI